MSTPTDFTYRARRTAQQAPSYLERYAEPNIISLLRQYFPKIDPRTGQKMPNFDFGPLVETAARLAAKIEVPTLHSPGDYKPLTPYYRTSSKRTRAF